MSACRVWSWRDLSCWYWRFLSFQAYQPTKPRSLDVALFKPSFFLRLSTQGKVHRLITIPSKKGKYSELSLFTTTLPVDHPSWMCSNSLQLTIVCVYTDEDRGWRDGKFWGNVIKSSNLLSSHQGKPQTKYVTILGLGHHIKQNRLSSSSSLPSSLMDGGMDDMCTDSDSLIVSWNEKEKGDRWMQETVVPSFVN